MIDMHTIGAGGGSIAHVDEGGAFRVGPQSAGRRCPGPPCYGLGGTEPTITDANVVLGRLDPERFLGGEMQLDRDAAAAPSTGSADAARARPLEAAEGIVDDRQRQHGARDPLAHDREGPRPARVRARRLRRRGPAARGARSPRSLGVPEVLVPPYPGITSADRAADQRPQVRPDAHRVFMSTNVDLERMNADLAAMESRVAANS